MINSYVTAMIILLNKELELKPLLQLGNKRRRAACVCKARTITIWLTRMFACCVSEVAEVLPDLGVRAVGGGRFFFLRS